MKVNGKINDVTLQKIKQDIAARAIPSSIMLYSQYQSNWLIFDTNGNVGVEKVVKASRVVFNIYVNKYRLVVEINYERQQVFIRFIGTHTDYDKIDANKI